MADNPLTPIYCIHCKKQIPSDSAFCNFCGKSQAPEAAAPVVPAAPVEVMAVATPANPAPVLTSPVVQAAIAQAGPNQQVVVIEQKNNNMPLILTLIALFTPVGCILPIGLLIGGAAFVAFLVGVLAFWPSALGAAVGFGIWKFAKDLPEEKRKQYALISVAAGLGINVLIFAWNSNALARHDIDSGLSKAGMTPRVLFARPGAEPVIQTSAPGTPVFVDIATPQPVQHLPYSSSPLKVSDPTGKEFLAHGDKRDVVRMEKERVAREKARRDAVQFAQHQALADATRLTDAIAKEKNFNADGSPKIVRVTVSGPDDDNVAPTVWTNGTRGGGGYRRTPKIGKTTISSPFSSKHPRDSHGRFRKK